MKNGVKKCNRLSSINSNTKIAVIFIITSNLGNFVFYHDASDYEVFDLFGIDKNLFACFLDWNMGFL